MHISYYIGKSGERNLEYAVGNFVSWDTEQIEAKADAQSSAGYNNSITIEEPGDTVRIVYGYSNHATSEQGIKMATGSFGSWTTEEIYAGSASYIDSALDEDGKTHVSFVDTLPSPNHLVYITNASLPLWQPVV
ncbi:MAG: hypothetical protein P8078_11505, partial [bacterium]